MKVEKDRDDMLHEDEVNKILERHTNTLEEIGKFEGHSHFLPFNWSPGKFKGHLLFCLASGKFQCHLFFPTFKFVSWKVQISSNVRILLIGFQNSPVFT